jgi:hypothetical protein
MGRIYKYQPAKGFPFHYGSIETNEARKLLAGQAHFHSTMVRLRQMNNDFAEEVILGELSPFHYGSIETQFSLPIILNIKYLRNHFFLYILLPSFLAFCIAIHYGILSPGF